MKTPSIKSLALSAAAISIASTPANATWSILIADTRTGEIVVGSATCLTGFDLAIETPVVLTGIGAITAQSSVDSTGQNRMLARDLLLERLPLTQVLDQLALTDPGHNNRQYGMITANGDTLTYSGPDNADWAGGITGRIEQGQPGPQDDIVYAVQGNILTGQPVVQAAVDAIIATDADLPERLMASMLAARQAGGDGRCSCSPATPTACGSPPPGDFKSAHVGYMIGSRAGDTDSIRAFYNLPNAQSVISTTLTQLDDDTFAIATDDGNIHLYNNATNPNEQTAHFTFNQTIETQLPNLSNLTAADLDNNGLQDLVVLSGLRDVAVFFQSAPGVFETPVFVPHPNWPVRNIESFDAPDLPGQQILITAGPGGYVQAYRFDGTEFTSTFCDFDEGAHEDAEFADLNNDGTQDFVDLGRPNSGGYFRVYTGNTAGNFVRSLPNTSTSQDPVKVRAADINNDNLIDILVATGSSRVIDAFVNTGTPESPTFAPAVSSPLANQAVDFQITDLNNDNIQDAVVLLAGGANLRYYLGDGAGNFSETNRTRLGGIPTDALLADLNNDGDMDLITNASNKLLIYDNLQNGIVQRQTGFARGDKYMFINIANQNAAAEDPVDQMLTQFNDFRMNQVGIIDAVQTKVTPPTRVLIDSPAAPQSVRIELLDFQNSPITAPTTFTIETDPAQLTAGTPQLIVPGIYEIPLTATSANGATPDTHPITIKATTTNPSKDPASYTIALMPQVLVPTTNSLADFNADAVHDYFDISTFLTFWTALSPVADLNNDALIDATDVTLFLNAFKSTP